MSAREVLKTITGETPIPIIVNSEKQRVRSIGSCLFA